MLKYFLGTLVFCIGLVVVPQFAMAANTTFDADTILDLTGMPSNTTLYAKSGSVADSLTANGAQLTADIPASSSFTLGTANYTVLALTPHGGTVSLTFNTSNFSTSYVTSWVLSSDVAAATINIAVGVSSSNKSYLVKVGGANLGYYVSTSNGIVNFSYTGGFSDKTFTIEQGAQLVSGGGGGGGGGGEAVTPTPTPTPAPAPVTTAPTVTPIAGLSLGDLIKASDHPAVYYYGSDGKRYVFPNEKTFKSWYVDFSSVKTITKAELASISIGQNVTYKPGARLVKFMTDPKTYAVTKNGILRWIKTEALAKALYGDSWNKLIDDINEAFFANYTIGLAIEKASDYDKTTELSQATDISADKGKTSAPTKLAVVAAKLKVISDWLNMRSGPSTTYKILAQLKLGDFLEKLDVSGKWIKVKTSVGKIGWVHLSYVQ